MYILPIYKRRPNPALSRLLKKFVLRPMRHRSRKPACPSCGPRPYSARLKLNYSSPLRILVAITGASGSLYAQRLLDNLDPSQHEVHVVLSRYAPAVIAEELPGGLRLPAGAISHNLKSMNAPFASGSNAPDAMVIIPCSMGTLGRIAHGYSEDVLLRAADVVLKEGRKLILVPRETPLNLIHVKNFELLHPGRRDDPARQPVILHSPAKRRAGRGYRRGPCARSSWGRAQAGGPVGGGKGMNTNGLSSIQAAKRNALAEKRPGSRPLVNSPSQPG